ncbi:MAG TPA: hypothetical protein VL978_04755 [Puia sp.]|nr:hypothetical protein [Puia sp.]
MSGTHPSDEALQQYVLDPTGCESADIGHIETCPACRESVATYRLLAVALKEQPAPAFDFDLAAMVIAQLEQPVTQREAPGQRKRKEGWVMTAVLIALAIVVPAWLFRRSAYFVFTDMSAVFYGVVLTIAGLVVGLFLLRLYKKYQDIIHLINK